MDFFVTFDKRIGPWLYQFDVFMFKYDTPASVKVGSAIIDRSNVTVMLPKVLDKAEDSVKQKCSELLSEIGNILEV